MFLSLFVFITIVAKLTIDDVIQTYLKSLLTEGCMRLYSLPYCLRFIFNKYLAARMKIGSV